MPEPPVITNLPPTSAGVAQAATLLSQGQLVILPTETIYGIGVNLASEGARHAARQIKARMAHADISGTSENSEAARSPWVIHVARAEDVLSWVPGLSAMGRRLVNKLSPGPVGFQIKLTPADEAAARTRIGGGAAADETIQDHAITFRCPDFRVTQDVLSAVPAPVAIIGAGSRTQPAVYEVSDMPAQLLPGDAAAGEAAGGAVIAAALDGGPTRYRRASTLVRIDGEHYAVVRQGVIDERIIHRMADFLILFVCSGNTCRSPMAAALAAKAIADKLKIQPSELPLRHIVIQSAGVHAAKGMRATLEAVDAVKELGADLTGHLSQPATADGGGLLRRADLIYTMTDAHREEILELYPWAERKTFRLDPEGDIADPIGASQAVYQKVARRLAHVIQERLSELPV